MEMCTNIRICVLPPQKEVEIGQEYCNKGYEDECKPSPARKCWEFSKLFTGGSLPWKGTTQQQEEAARRAEAEAACADPPCRWHRCAQLSCPPFRCSGSYPLEEHRPTCKEITKPIDKSLKKQWCWTPEASILFHCDPCPPPRYFCPEEVKKEICPDKLRKTIPIFMWKYGIPYPNICRAPYPHLLECLDWKKFPEDERPLRRDTDLWVEGCTTMIGSQPVNLPCTVCPPCPGRFVRDKPLFTWRNGYPKENYAQEPYPGHGPKPFDPCRFTLEQRRLREHGPPRPHVTPEQQQKLCRMVGGCKNAWCAALAESTATHS